MVTLKHVLIFSALSYVLLIHISAKFYISSNQLLSDPIMSTGKQVLTNSDSAAYSIYIYHNFVAVLHGMPATPMLSSHLDPFLSTLF